MIFRRLLWIAIVLMIAFNLAVFFKGREIVLLYNNAKTGCFPWSPAEVEYHEGMTLCPGQSARAPVLLREPGKKNDRGI